MSNDNEAPDVWRQRTIDIRLQRAQQRRQYGPGDYLDLFTEMKRLAGIAQSALHSPHAKERARGELEEIFRRYRVKHLHDLEVEILIEKIRVSLHPTMSREQFGAAVQMALDPLVFVKDIPLTSKEKMSGEDTQKILAAILL